MHGPDNLRIRAHTPADAGITRSIFLESVVLGAAHDYTPEQLRAWASPSERPVAAWDVDRKRADSLVATIGHRVVGFVDPAKCGYVDMLFVSPHFLRLGVASALMAEVEKRARAEQVVMLWSNVSITARPFFDAKGFFEVDTQYPVIHGVTLKNFRMNKHLV